MEKKIVDYRTCPHKNEVVGDRVKTKWGWYEYRMCKRCHKILSQGIEKGEKE